MFLFNNFVKFPQP